MLLQGPQYKILKRHHKVSLYCFGPEIKVCMFNLHRKSVNGTLMCLFSVKKKMLVPKFKINSKTLFILGFCEALKLIIETFFCISYQICVIKRIFGTSFYQKKKKIIIIGLIYHPLISIIFFQLHTKVKYIM